MSEISKQFFQWPDYLLFSLMLIVCILIGIYYGFYKVSKNVTDYLIGSRNMSVWPVSISLVVSFVSGISFLGFPTEVYIYGIQILYSMISVFIAGYIGKKIFLPVFIEMQLTSTYEYLERRFDSKVRKFGSTLFLIQVGLWLPVVIYVPALALNYATGVNVHIITPIVCGVCIFYTCVGGIRAVIWTDFLQAFIMLGSVILVIAKATINVGGFDVVIQRNLESGRIEPPDFDLSITKRLSFFGLIVGGTFFHSQTGILNQIMMQRYISLPTLKDAIKALWIFLLLQGAFLLMCGFTGLLIFATYYDCDPVTAKIVKAKDQVLPLLVIDTLQGIPGTAGLFLSGVFSASLSSLSSGLNSMAAVILEDGYRAFVKNVSPKEANIVAKVSVVIVGIVTVSLVFIVEKLGTIIQLSGSLNSITSGPLLTLFGLGLLCPWVNAKGALYGGVSGLLFMFWMVFGAQAALANNLITYPIKNVTVEGCAFNVTGHTTTTPTPIADEGNVLFLYRISFMYYTFVGFTVATIVALLVTYFTGGNRTEDVNHLHIAPCVRRYFSLKKEIGKDNVPPEGVDLLKKSAVKI